MAFLLSSNTGGSGPNKKFTKFEIRTDDDFIVFRGEPNETPSTYVRGQVVLMNTETIKTQGLRLSLEGKRRTQHFITRPEAHTGLPASSMLTNKTTFIHEEIQIKDDRGLLVKSLPPGNHTFPFEFYLAGDTSESIEGMQGNHIVYELKAVAERGVLAKDLICRHHLRIIRTIGPDALESGIASAVSGVWPDKLKYLFEPVSKNVIFGTSLSCDIELTPLIEKLGIEKIKFSLREIRKIRTDPGPEYSQSTGKWHGRWKEESEVYTETMTLPENCGNIDVDSQLSMFKFRATFQLPKSLAVCRQTVEDNEWISIKHHAHYDILLRNPDGHLSELKAHHPTRLFISPNLPVQENNSVATSPHETPQSETDPLGDLSAPPVYGEHQMDLLVNLYQDIDPSGFFTPAIRSGAATPFIASRSGSFENLSALTALTSTGAHPSVLHNRLRNLQVRDSEDHHPPTSRIHAPSGGRSPGGAPLEPRISNPEDYFYAGPSTTPPQPEGRLSEEHVEYDIPALSRMPSYNTAVRQHARPTDQLNGLPSYALATSRPPSPQLQAPRQAHVRSGHHTPTDG